MTKKKTRKGRKEEIMGKWEESIKERGREEDPIKEV